MRVPRTFVFADLSGFTNYTAAYGDDAAGRPLSAFRGVAREVASDRGVRIAKWLGDGCMIVAVDQADGVAAALDLDERARKVCAPLALRVGIASGYVAALRGRRLHRPRPSTWPPGCATPPARTRCSCRPSRSTTCPTASTPSRTARWTCGASRPGRRWSRWPACPLPTHRHDTGELWTRSPYVAVSRLSDRAPRGAVDRSRPAPDERRAAPRRRRRHRAAHRRALGRSSSPGAGHWDGRRPRSAGRRGRPTPRDAGLAAVAGAARPPGAGLVRRRGRLRRRQDGRRAGGPATSTAWPATSATPSPAGSRW